MKNKFLKSLLASAVLSVAVVAVAFAGPDEKFIDVSKLPSQAQKFIKQHYPTEAVISVQKDTDDDRDYEVIFKNGTHLEFDRNGKIKEVNAGKDGTLPASLTAKLPGPVAAYLNDNYPGTKITSIEPDGKGVKIGISGKDIDLIFDKKGKYLGADD